jgi:DNA-binding NtrC family response regulator
MKKKILIVEDEFVVANDLRIMLEAAGYEVMGIAISAEAAMKELEKNIPDIVLLDIQLQGKLSGIDLAKQLRTKHIAFVYLSANSDQATLQRARATEPYGFLVKPVRTKDLLITLDIACYRHEHSLESFLIRKQKLRSELSQLLDEELDRSSLLLQFAEVLQKAVPFDLVCFAWPTNEDGPQFQALLRSGFNEYQQIDKSGLGNIAAKNAEDIDRLLSGVFDQQYVRQFSDDAYVSLLKQDALAQTLHDVYSFQSAIRCCFNTGASAACKMYVFNKLENKIDDRQVAVFEEAKDLMEKMIKRFKQEQSLSARGLATTQANNHQVFSKLIGKSKSILHCLDLVTQVAPLNTSVLILGESGTGKELFAEAIHQLSKRNRQPFVKINCAALPYSLIESELFGYEKGAFTGALTSRMGKFEAASGGTIFLDEIGEMSLEVQAKLLRVLQEKKVQRVGSHKTIDTDVRVIAATNRDLEKAVAEHRFRLDLYFRLNVFPIQLPPLRERMDDIHLLVENLGRQIAQTMGREYYGVSDEMIAELEQYDWPGNVRELENIIERALIISAQDKPMSLSQPLSALGTQTNYALASNTLGSLGEIKQQQDESERKLIEVALRESKGKIRGADGAAEKLDIKPTTLESKLIRMGIRKEDFQ